MPQSDHSGQGNVAIDQAAIVLHLFGFFLEQKDNCPSPTGDVERLVRGVENQDSCHRRLWSDGCQKVKQMLAQAFGMGAIPFKIGVILYWRWLFAASQTVRQDPFSGAKGKISKVSQQTMLFR